MGKVDVTMLRLPTILPGKFSVRMAFPRKVCAS
jgi:hypothetical protein